MEKTLSRLERGAASLCLLAAAALLALPLANPDLFWHLSAGRWIAGHGAVPSADWLSFTKAGAPWADFEWLPQLLYYAALRAGGLAALCALKALTLGAAGVLLWLLLRRRFGVGALGGAAAVLAWLLASPAGNDLRPENFSLVLFLSVLDRCEAARLAGRAAPTRGELAACAALFELWANLHAGFVYGLGLLALYGAGAAWRVRSARPLAPAGVAAAAALANPYGWQVYTVPLLHYAALGDLQTYILEWQEASVLSPWLAPLWALMALSFSALAWRRWRRQEAPFEHAALLAALSWSAAAHVRTSPYFAAAALTVTAASSAAALSAPARRAGAALAAAALLAFAGRLYPPVFARGMGGFDPLYVPARAARWLEAARAELRGRRLFCPWHWGGYLGWRLDGETPVFADGRYLFHDLLKSMYDATASPETYAAFLDGQRVEAAVLKREAQFLPMVAARKDGSKVSLRRPFYVFFLPRERWALVYWDDKALVFLRRSAFDEKWLAAREYRWFRPDDLRAAALAVSEGEAPFADVAAEANRWAAGAEKGDAAAAKLWLAELARST